MDSACGRPTEMSAEGEAVSLDYLLLKPLRVCESLEELEPDNSVTRRDLEALAMALWPSAQWDHASHGIASYPDQSMEISISDSGVHIAWRGSADVMVAMSRVATAAAAHGYVLVDVQTSELFMPEGDHAENYAAWYASVIKLAAG